ncbi:hypothetical protein [Pseudalkalibacillus sp. R45]
MTKFSVYEHSQPDERPAEIPELEELKEDIKVTEIMVRRFHRTTK